MNIAMADLNIFVVVTTHGFHLRRFTVLCRLLDVMLNFISNAFKFTPKGTVTISAQLDHEVVEDMGQPMLQLCVSSGSIGNQA